MIIIAGESYAMGEVKRGDLQTVGALQDTEEWLNEFKEDAILHTGLEQYIADAGYDVVNLGFPGYGNLAVTKRLSLYLEHERPPIEKIFVYQTDYVRDYLLEYPEDYEKIETAWTLPHIMLARYYSRLTEVAKKANCTVYVIGGCVETLPPDLVKRHYPGVEVCCQSLVNLLINDTPRVDNPVLSWYNKTGAQLVKRVRAKLPESELPQFMQCIEDGAMHRMKMITHPEYFWPDGIHPNRVGFKKLFDYLVAEGYLQ